MGPQAGGRSGNPQTEEGGARRASAAVDDCSGHRHLVTAPRGRRWLAAVSSRPSVFHGSIDPERFLGLTPLGSKETLHHVLWWGAAFF